MKLNHLDGRTRKDGNYADPMAKATLDSVHSISDRSLALLSPYALRIPSPNASSLHGISCIEKDVRTHVPKSHNLPRQASGTVSPP